MSETITEYVAKCYRQFAAGVWPDGLDWGGIQHRDTVRLWIASAFVMDRGMSPELEALAMEATADGWTPGEEWQWPASAQN